MCVSVARRRHRKLKGQLETASTQTCVERSRNTKPTFPSLRDAARTERYANVG
jgi:hypothetical protein